MAAWAARQSRPLGGDVQQPACSSRNAALPLRQGASCQSHRLVHCRTCLAVSRGQLAGQYLRSQPAVGSNTALQCQRTERSRQPPRGERQTATDSDEPDPQATYACFDSIGNSATVHVFGLNHLEVEYAAAEFIWRTKPAVVAVETAFTPDHGARTGGVLSATDYMQRGTDFRLRMLSQVAAQLAEDTSRLPEDSELWQNLKEDLPGEQLVYVVAFAVGAQLMYADRPKDTTIQRLYNIPSLAELDAAFGRLSTDNYRELLAKHQGGSYAPLPAADDCVYSILTAERDAIMAHSLRSVADLEGPTKTVVGVVGQSHMPGIAQALQQQRQLDRPAIAALNEAGEAPAEDAQAAGARRALLRAALGLCCSGEILAELDRTLGPLPPDQEEPFAVTQEIYGTTRMLLSCLPRDELELVCGGWECNMWEVLAPLRAVRPVNSGPGCDIELALDLQMLYLEIGGTPAVETVS